MSHETKVAVIGVGHLGKFHARLLSEIPDCELVGVCDTDFEKASQIASECNTTTYKTAEELLEKVDAICIVVPTIAHYNTAKMFLEKGIATFIEKPFTKTLEEANELLELANSQNTVLQVGHIERYNPAFKSVSDYVEQPLFIESNRISPYSFRSTDISVILDLMVHDLDLILHFVKSPVKEVSATGVSILSKEEDIANARVTFEDGCVANLTASRMSLKAERSLRLFQKDAYISIDFQTRQAKYYSKGEMLKNKQFDLSKINLAELGNPKDFVFSNLINIKEFQLPEANPLKEELEDFIHCIQTGATPTVTGEHGKRAIEAAKMIEAAIRKD